MTVVIQHERETSLTEASKKFICIIYNKYYIYLPIETQIINIIIQRVPKLHKKDSAVLTSELEVTSWSDRS